MAVMAAMVAAAVVVAAPVVAEAPAVDVAGAAAPDGVRAGLPPTLPAGRVADALAQARQAPQASPRAPGRPLPRPGQGAVRRIRPQVTRGGLAVQPADRGRPYRHDPEDQAWWQGLDQRVSGQAVHQEAG